MNSKKVGCSTRSQQNGKEENHSAAKQKSKQSPASQNRMYNEKAVSLGMRIKSLGIRWRFGKYPSAKVEAFQILNQAIVKDKENFTNEDERTANNLVFHSFLKFAKTSDDIRYIMNVTMPEAGLTPDLPVYAALIEELIMEGDWESAEEVLSKMDDVKVKPDKLIFYALFKESEAVSKSKRRMIKGFHAGRPKASPC